MVTDMKRRILLGVDTNLSQPTQQALATVGDFFERATPPVYLILLHVIPLSQITPLHPGFYGQVVPVSASNWQYKQADEVLAKARRLLQQRGWACEYIEEVVRVGVPAEEILKVARERRVNCIIIGSRGGAWKQRLRRFFIGSLSRRVLQLAPCPVMIVVPPQAQTTVNLVAWYENAITTYLEDHSSSLTIFTPKQVASQFTLPQKQQIEPGQGIERKEIEAAAQALELLSQQGILFRYEVQGELHYVND